MNKKFLTLLGLTTAALVLSSCGGTRTYEKEKEVYEYPTSLRVTHQSVSLRVGESEKLEAYTRPLASKSTQLIYESENPAVARVNSDGEITAVGGGITEISVKAPRSAKEGDYLVTKVMVYVTNPTIAPGDMKPAIQRQINMQAASSLTNYIGQEYSLTEVYENEVLKKGRYDDCDYIYYTGENEGRAGFKGFEVSVNTLEGSPVDTEYAWQLYCDKDYQTMFYHDSGANIRNYTKLDTSSYIGKNRIEPCLDLINALFTNGKEILVQHQRLITQSEFLSAYVDDKKSSDYFSVTKNMGYYDDDANNIHMITLTLSEEYTGQTVTADEESKLNIPYGTRYTEVFSLSLTFLNGFARIFIQDTPMTYELDGKSYYRADNNYTAYQINSEVQVPRPNQAEYSWVDEVFDL